MLNFLSHYTPPKAKHWTGRAEIEPAQRYYQVIECIDLANDPKFNNTAPCIGLVGFASDAGVTRNLGRKGAKDGPNALRMALANLPIHFTNTPTLLDLGNIVCEDNNLEAAQQSLGELVAYCQQQNIFVIVLGGGHEVAWGHYQGIVKTHPSERLGIINFDAHFDLRPLLADNHGSSGTPFLQIAEHRKQQNLNFDYFCIGIQRNANSKSLFDTAEQLNVDYILADKIHRGDNITTQLDQFIAQVDSLYVTLCLDVFAAAIAPGVSAPQATGLFAHQVQYLLQHIVNSKKVMHFDIAELSPPLDRDQMTAKLAAQLLSDVLHLLI